MKKRIIGLIIGIFILTSQIGIGSASSVVTTKKTIAVNGQNKTVNLVTIDLKDPTISLGVTTANNRIAGNEDFSSMIKRKKPIVAINGNYFDAYKTLEPMGPIMVDGKLEYLAGSPSSLVVYEDGTVDMGPYSIRINGYINGERSNQWNNTTQSMDFNLFGIWYVNNLPKDSSGVYLFTPKRGESIELKGGIAIEVIEDKVTKVIKNPGKTNIPKNGYIIYYGNIEDFGSYVDQRFKIGSKIELEYEINLKKVDLAAKDNESSIEKKTPASTEATALKENKVKSIISAGPYLVEEGKVVFDQNSSLFKEDKITKNRAQRSAVGITKDKQLILVTGSNINMAELSHIMVKLGADKAMNLDGGASSALYANGKVITQPGRKLNTSLMVYKN